MKKRMATLAIVGAMAVAAMAPATVFAATGQSEVYYKHGAGAPEGSDGSYVITFPTNITFNSNTGLPSETTHDVTLSRTSDKVGLPKDLSVSLEVKSDNSMKLEDANGHSVNYQIKYAAAAASSSTVTVETSLTDSKIGSDTAAAGANNAASDTTIATFTGEGTLEGTPTMYLDGTKELPSGTELTDVLTYTATQDTPATN